MSAEFERITREALALDPDEKAELARTLLETLGSDMDADIEAAWAAEAERRYAALKAGKEESVPGDEAMARAFRELQ